MRQLLRKTGFTASVGLVLFLVGCGGDNSGHTTNTVNTGTDEGTLANLEISPAPGSVFIGKDTSFKLTWVDGTTPPPTFSVTLQRYTEGSDSGSTSAQKTDLTREGDSYVWDLNRSSGFALDSPGVYYLEVDAGEEQVLASYIVSSERAEAVAATKAASVRATAEPAAESTKGESGFVHVVNVRGAK